MKYTKILSIGLFLLILFSSCGKANDEKDYVFHGYEQETKITAVESSYIINGQDVSFDSVKMHIPQEYSITDKGNSLQINKEGVSFNISVEEHKYSDDNFECYLSNTIDEFRQIGADVSEPEMISIGDYDMQQIKISFNPMYAYGYFADQGDKGFFISIIFDDKETELKDVDELLSKIELSLY